MRTLARFVLVAAVVAVLPSAPAEAIKCQEPLNLVCETLCDVNQTLGRPCLK